VIGVIFITTLDPKQILEEQVRLFMTMAEIAGTAIQRTRLHEETRQQLERLSSLRTVDLAISGNLDLTLVLKVVLEQALAQLHVDAAAILLLNHDSGMLEYAAGRGFHTNEIARTSVRLHESYVGRAVLERHLIHIPNLARSQSAFKRQTLIGLENFASYYALPLIAKGTDRGVLEVFHRKPLALDDNRLRFLEALAGQAAIAIDNAQLFTGLQRSNLELALAYDTTLEGWSRALDLRDHETEGHTQRVTETTLRLARELNVEKEELVHLRRGALLHDIGKMGIPDNILLKPGPLTNDEWEIMRRHPVYAAELLSEIPYLRPALDIPYAHHEKWDGTGYPRGLCGEQIPFAARLFAIVDVWDALLSDRPYRKAWSKERVYDHIQALAGSHFDPDIVPVFLKLIRDDV
jgi:putative nucleotidyltransferase with HDIG domain